jgi:hypothetical protein
MRADFSKKTVSVIIMIIIIAGILAFVIWQNSKKIVPAPVEINTAISQKSIIGLSVQGREIEAFTYGKGSTTLAFVGGIHGGYEWNSVLLAYKLMDYLEANPEIIPKNISVIVIPALNPDGVSKVVGKDGRFTVTDVPNNIELTKVGRFNMSGVDLNRNFDCHWQATSTWRSKIVSAGESVFSEPEAKAFQNFVLKNNLSAVVFWHSQSNGVYASMCQNGILPGTLDLMNTYSIASGYPAQKSFDSYAITGAADDWLASINIPAVSVELKTHESIEWDKNLAGILALFKYYTK